MNHKSLLAFVLLGFAVTAYAERNVTPTIINRSQGRSADLKVAGLAEKLHLYGEDRYVNVDATVEYGQSFRSSRLAQCLFGSDLICNKTILVQGSEVADRNAHAWLADYFYLAPDYDASFSIVPKIQNVVVNLDLYIGLDNWLEGLYFRAHGPLTWSKWDLNFCEPCDVITTNSYPQGYFDWIAMENGQLLNTFGQYASGSAPAATSGVDAVVDQTTLGVTFNSLQYGKIERCSRQRTGFADLRLELGYDFLSSENYHLGISAQVVAPSGSRRDAEFAFDPTIGNGNHWEVGAGLSAHYLFWQSQAEDKYAGFYLDANITHINNARERRTFDLCGRPNSRYMLAMKMGTPVNFLRAGETNTSEGNTSVPIAQFKGVYAPVANLTTVDVHVRNSIQADVAAMFNFTMNNWGIDVGYDFWVRSCEKIKLPDRPTKNCCPNLCTSEQNTWALKGDAYVFGYLSAASGSLAINTPIALSGTQCGATIHKGTNADSDSTDCSSGEFQNCGVDNSQFAYARGPVSGNPDHFLIYPPGFTTLSNIIKTSLEPKFINCCDINFQRTRGLSHKVFANVNYTWELQGWSPYVGVGGSAEFASHSSDDCCQTIAPNCDTVCADNCCTTDCSCCLDCAVSQWAVWIKGGVSFN